MNFCEHCRQEDAEIVATIPDDYRGDSQEALCLECYEQARVIGAFLSTAYACNRQYIATNAA